MTENDGEEEQSEEEPEEEEEDLRFIHLTDEQKEDLRNEIKQMREDDLRERKLSLLTELEKQVKESGKLDVELAEITKLKLKLESWNAILENESWEEILKEFFRVVYAMTQKMAHKTVLTISGENGEMLFSYEFFDSNGERITTEFNDKAEEEEEK